MRDLAGLNGYVDSTEPLLMEIWDKYQNPMSWLMFLKPFFRLETPNWILLQTVKTQMKCHRMWHFIWVAFHLGLRSLLRSNQSSEKEVLMCESSIYTMDHTSIFIMDHTDLTVSNFKKKSIPL